MGLKDMFSGMFGSNENQDGQNERIKIPDEALNEYLNRLIKQNEAGFRKKDIEYVFKIDMLKSNNEVKSLEGLQYAKKLEELWLKSETLSDLTPLAGLTNLSTLYLECPKIESIEPLRETKSLFSLFLTGAAITDISPLDDLSDLEYVSLDGCKVADLSALQDKDFSIEFEDEDNPSLRDMRPEIIISAAEMPNPLKDQQGNYVPIKSPQAETLGADNAVLRIHHYAEMTGGDTLELPYQRPGLSGVLTLKKA